MSTKRPLPVSPNSGDWPMKLMWSVISMTLPGCISRRRLPAELVRISVVAAERRQRAHRQLSSRRRGHARNSARGPAAARPACRRCGRARACRHGPPTPGAGKPGRSRIRDRRRRSSTCVAHSRRARSRARCRRAARSRARARGSPRAHFNRRRHRRGPREIVGAEGQRQQFAHGDRCGARPRGSHRWIGTSSAANSLQMLAAAAARRDQRFAFAHHHRLDDAPSRRPPPSRRSPRPRRRCPADRRHSRHCSPHRACRWRRAAPRRPGSASRAHRRGAITARASAIIASEAADRPAITAPSRTARRSPWARPRRR